VGLLQALVKQEDSSGVDVGWGGTFSIWWTSQIKYRILFGIAMPKSLGQIHTVNYNFDPSDVSLTANSYLHIDLPGQLTDQLQHMVRMMSTFKVVGIDMDFSPTTNNSRVVASMSGRIQYFAPTKGRCEALKMAYNAVRRMMKLSGVKPSNAGSYDFRPIIRDPSVYQNAADIVNQAAIEDTGLASCLANGPAGNHNIFGLYNQGVLPREALGATTFFEAGFDTGLRNDLTSADWTLNEKVTLMSPLVPLASEEYEEIPFALSWSGAGYAAGPPVVVTEVANNVDLQWRPDPALYLSVLTGQLSIIIDEAEVTKDGEPEPLGAELSVAVHVAGWKSILGSRHKKRGSSKKGKKHGRKRHGKK